jgi:hypothetical protein
MAGSALRDREKKLAFYRGVLRSGGAVDPARLDSVADDLARRTSQIWLWDPALASEMAAVEPPPAATPPPSPVPPAEQTATPAPPEFDPFAFSAVVVLTRQGRAALLKRLAAIDDPRHLLQLADAQHLGIDRSLTNPERLREAIVKGAEQRIADRRAAAS